MFERRKSKVEQRKIEAVTRVVMAFGLSELAAQQHQAGSKSDAEKNYTQALHLADGDPLIESLITIRGADTMKQAATDDPTKLNEAFRLVGDAHATLRPIPNMRAKDIIVHALSAVHYNSRKAAYEQRSKSEETTTDMHGIGNHRTKVVQISGYPALVEDSGARELILSLVSDSPTEISEREETPNLPPVLPDEHGWPAGHENRTLLDPDVGHQYGVHEGLGLVG